MSGAALESLFEALARWPLASLLVAAVLGGLYTLLGLAALAGMADRGRLPRAFAASVPGGLALLALWPGVALLVALWPRRRA